MAVDEYTTSVADPTTDYGRYDHPNIIKALRIFNAKCRPLDFDDHVWDKLLLDVMDACWQNGFDEHE